ncbi:protein yippee-like 5 isoform X1 [Poecilia reticulata]|nr:PREDICTED: protein yippee-like 5 isoform X1 [Poecilia reticulata]
MRTLVHKDAGLTKTKQRRRRVIVFLRIKAKSELHFDLKILFSCLYKFLVEKMGRIFLDHIGGSRLFSCANCDTILTNRAELISTRFTGATGRAFLFNKVVNLQHSEVQDRVMLTGRHMVRDVSCKNCNSKLGWMYEFATEESQRYKEGRIILERALVRESEGFEHVPSDTS